MDLASRLLRCALHPVQGFQERVAAGPRLWESFSKMMLLRSVLAIIGGLGSAWTFYQEYPVWKDINSPVWTQALRYVPQDFSQETLAYYLKNLPSLPPWSHVWPWILIIGPVSIASAWLHNAVWDDISLWMLGGLNSKRGWRTTFLAEAEAMQVGALDALLGLLRFVPVVGVLLWPILGLSGIYFWVMRGISLAAFHGAPVWKGVVATLLHVVLAIFFMFGMLVLSWLIVMQSVVVG